MEFSLRRSLPRLLAALFLLLAVSAFALPAGADEGDLDEITRYVVTVEPRADGTADMTYEIEWSVIGGSADDPLTWVRIGLPNSHCGSLENLSPDTVSSVTADSGSDGTFAVVAFQTPYYAPEAAAQNGGASRVSFAFRVHQSHLFLLDEEGRADYSFTPGWFDDLCVDSLTVRWLALDGMEAPDAQREGDYWVWSFGPLKHGEKVSVQVSVPAQTAQEYDPDAAAADSEMYYDRKISLTWLWVLLVLLAAAWFVYRRRARARWEGGFGAGDPDDWYWYSNGAEIIHVARALPPPEGYHRVEAPKGFAAGGGSTRGGGAGRRSGTGKSTQSGSHNSGCACVCACVSHCACACACAGGGRAGCSAKNFYRVTIKNAD